MKFKIVSGYHSDAATKRVYEAGDIVESDQNLAEVFKNKFNKVGNDEPVSLGKPIAGIGHTKPIDPNNPDMAKKLSECKAVRNGKDNWDVLGLDGKPVNTDPLTKKEAMTLERKMNAGR